MIVMKSPNLDILSDEVPISSDIVIPPSPSVKVRRRRSSGAVVSVTMSDVVVELVSIPMRMASASVAESAVDDLDDLLLPDVSLLGALALLLAESAELLNQLSHLGEVSNLRRRISSLLLSELLNDLQKLDALLLMVPQTLLMLDLLQVIQ